MARAEVETVCGCPTAVVARGLARVADVAGSDWRPLERLAYARAVYRYLGQSRDATPPFDPRPLIAGSFAVRVHHLAEAPAAATKSAAEAPRMAARIGADIWRALPRPRVDLNDPDTDIHVFVGAHRLWWGLLLLAIDSAGFTVRRPTARPFWRSTAMAPRKARCLVNLSGVRLGGSLLDPFCGTGSIPIEAALIGADAYASDIDGVVVAGAAQNFASLGLDKRIALRQLDARAWGAAGRQFDAVVSDLPYGRAASTKGTDRTALYRDLLDVATQILRPGGRAVLMAAVGALPMPPARLKILWRFREVVHSSLTREVMVLTKTGSDATETARALRR